MNQDGSTLNILISTMFRLIAVVLYGIVVRSAYKESEIKNGLILLREQLLAASVFLFITNLLSIFVLVVRAFADAESYKIYSELLGLLNGFGFLIVAYILYKIYTQQYTPEQKELHKKIAKLEDKRKK